MGVGIALLRKMIEENRPPSMLSDSGLDLRAFVSEEAVAYGFIDKYYRRYHKMPTWATVKKAAKLNNVDFPDEPISYWLDQVAARYKVNTMATTFREVSDMLAKGDDYLDTAIQKVRELALRLDSHSGGERLSKVSDLLDSVLIAHDARQISAGLSGVPFGLEYLDKVSDGAQPTDTVALVGRPGVGKCLAKDTKVLMHDGTIRMVQDVVPGDRLMGPDSTPRTVRSVTSGEQEMFWVTPKNGDPFGCNREHILSLWVSGKSQIVNVSVADYLKKSEKFKAKAKLWKVAVDYGDRGVPYDPYFIGLYLAEGGTLRPTLTLNSGDKVLHSYSKACVKDMGYRFSEYREKGDCRTYGIVGPAGRREENVFHRYSTSVLFDGGERRIPDCYKVNSRQVRLEVLAGVLDGDGSVSHNCYDITTKYPKLADDIAYVARSVGLRVTVSDSIKGVESLGFTGCYKRITISGDTDKIPCKVEHKRCTKRKMNKNPLVCGFSVESIGEGQYFGFDIDGDHLFLLGDFTVTHNTYFVLNMARIANISGAVPLFVPMEMSAYQSVRRLTALEANVPATSIRLGRLSYWGRDKLGKTIAEVKKAGRPPFYLMEGSLTTTVEDIVMRVEELRPTILYVDGAYMLQTKTRHKAKWERVSEVAEYLKMVAKDYNIPVIATWQFNRKGPGSLGNIMYSDSVGQLASIVAGIENEKSGGLDEWEAKSTKIFNLLKGREGESGRLRVLYDMNRMVIEQLEVLSGR